MELIDFSFQFAILQHFCKGMLFMKVGLVDLSTYGGKFEFEILVLKIHILFSRHVKSTRSTFIK